MKKQARAELCQAQDQLGLPVKTELLLEFDYPISVALGKTYILC